MARINISIPDELAERLKESDLKVSRICARALEQALGEKPVQGRKIARRAEVQNQEPKAVRRYERPERADRWDCSYDRECPWADDRSFCERYKTCVRGNPSVLPQAMRRRFGL